MDFNMSRIKSFLFIAAMVTIACSQVIAQVKTKTIKAPVQKTLVKAGVLVSLEPWKQPLNREKFVEISTDYGVMIAKLYDSTPLHRDNFIKLVQQGFYDSLMFHRIIEWFMIQGGDPESKHAADGAMLGNGSAPGNRIPAEIKPYLFHKKGSLAAARDNNPEKASSNCQFYIVMGKLMPEAELTNAYNTRVKPSNTNFTYTKAQQEIYARIGGTPFLDQSYTVFGEVIFGLNVIDKIAKLPRNANDRPLQNIRMKMKLLN